MVHQLSHNQEDHDQHRGRCDQGPSKRVFASSWDQTLVISGVASGILFSDGTGRPNNFTEGTANHFYNPRIFLPTFRNSSQLKRVLGFQRLNKPNSSQAPLPCLSAWLGAPKRQSTCRSLYIRRLVKRHTTMGASPTTRKKSWEIKSINLSDWWLCFELPHPVQWYVHAQEPFCGKFRTWFFRCCLCRKQLKMMRQHRFKKMQHPIKQSLKILTGVSSTHAEPKKTNFLIQNGSSVPVTHRVYKSTKINSSWNRSWWFWL